MATTTVSLSDCSGPKWEIAGVLSHPDCVQEDQQFTGAAMYLVCTHKVNSRIWWRRTLLDNLQQVRHVSIPNNVTELSDGCFSGCRSLVRVTFSLSSSLERIGVSCFAYSGVEEMSIPDGVRELCDYCFAGCGRLHRVNFGPSSSLEMIGDESFGLGKVVDDDGYWYGFHCGLWELRIPDGVRELCDRCFQGCLKLDSVTFGPSSSLERIGVEAFADIWDEYGEHYFCNIEDISIPDSVRELCDRCFRGCRSLRRVNFGPSSSLERIGVSCFEDSGVEEVSIPDGVRELCDNCFKGCKNLRRVTFGCSSLKRIGSACFDGCSHFDVKIPESVWTRIGWVLPLICSY